MSIIFYIKSSKEKKPTYFIRSFNLVKKRITKIDQLQIIYGNTPINNLTVTKIAIWNSGRETINSEDVAPKDPIKIRTENESVILKANIIYVKKDANNFRIELDELNKNLNIIFDYFHTNEGIVIELYHTGTSSKDLNLIGTIKSVNKFYYAEVDKALLDIYYNKTVGHLLTKINKFWGAIFFILMTPFLLFLIVIVPPLSLINYLTSRLPKEYYLSDEK